MKPSRGLKTICLRFESEAQYQQCVEKDYIYRQFLLNQYAKYPEIFPPNFDDGFDFHEKRQSKKLGIVIRRIKLKSSGETYSIRPSFVMPYMTAKTDDVEKGLYLKEWGVPNDALAYVFGKNPMFWYRAYLSLGRPSIVGTTIKDKWSIPLNLISDEKHTRLKKEKVFVAVTVAEGCILGSEVVPSASGNDLEKGYGVFAAEAREINPYYMPQTVCADGWNGTWDAWKRLFPNITIIFCFLHSVLKISTCYTSEKWKRFEVTTMAWEAFWAKTKTQFSQRIRRLREWSQKHLLSGPLREKVLKLCEKRDLFKKAYNYPNSYRTSNGVDRLMNYQDRILYAMQYFHGNIESATLLMRATAVLWNFHPYGVRLMRKDKTRISPFHDINGFVYHKNWLHNYLIASSLGGHRSQD